MPRLLHPEERRDAYLSAFYKELEKHQPFIDDFRTLHDRLRLPWPTSEDRVVIAPEHRQLIREFVARWHLPPVSTEDIVYALQLATLSGEQPRSIFVHRRSTRSGFASEPAVIAGKQVRMTFREPFVYVPQLQSGAAARREARRRAKALYEKLLRRIEDVERDAKAMGWTRLAPREKAWMSEMASRAFRRGVLRRKWKEIAEEDVVTDLDDMARRVRRWAKTAGILA